MPEWKLAEVRQFRAHGREMLRPDILKNSLGGRRGFCFSVPIASRPHRVPIAGPCPHRRPIALAPSPLAPSPPIALAPSPWPHRPWPHRRPSPWPHRPRPIALAPSPWPHRPRPIALAPSPWPTSGRVRSTIVDAHPEFRSQNTEFRRISRTFVDKCASVRVHAIEVKSRMGGKARKSLLCNFLDSGFWILDSGFWILDSGFWILDSGFFAIQQS